MMVIDIVKFFKGYVRVIVTGYSPERVLNLCGNKRIHLWDIKPVKGGFIFSISKKALLMLDPILEKSRCEMKILDEKGFPVRKKSLLRRRVFLSSVILCILLITSLSTFIWRIDISGNIYNTDEEILKYLELSDIRIGAFKYGIKTDELERLIFDEYNDIIWTSCEVKGTQLIIDVREELKVEEVIPDDQICDLIANKEGEIVSILAQKGTPVVAKGDIVAVGDTLISGNLEYYEYDILKYVNFTHAKGDVYIKTVIDYYDEINLRYIEKVYDDIEYYDKSIIINDKEIDLFKPRNTDYNMDEINELSQIEVIENFYLPIKISKSIYKPYIEVEDQYSKAETEAILEKNLKRELEEIEKNDIQISKINVIYTHTDVTSIAYGTIEIVEKIGVKKIFNADVRRQQYNEFFTEEDGDTT